MNEKRLRFAVLVAACALHIVVLFFIVFDVETFSQEEAENARVMKLTDFDELPPPPPPEIEPEIPVVEEIAEIMIETDIPPVQNVVAAGTLHVQVQVEENYMPMHLLSTPPKFDESTITAELVYPPIALRSGIEGRVILELFVDRTGTVQRITILREDPQGRGFGEAAVRAFTGRKGVPATSNGEAVSARFRYPLIFKIR